MAPKTVMHHSMAIYRKPRRAWARRGDGLGLPARPRRLRRRLWPGGDDRSRALAHHLSEDQTEYAAAHIGARPRRLRGEVRDEHQPPLVTIDATHRPPQQRLTEATSTRHARIRAPGTPALTPSWRRRAAPGRRGRRPPGCRESATAHGHERVKVYLEQARLLEHAMALLKARLYGEVHAAYLPWPDVWDVVRRPRDAQRGRADSRRGPGRRGGRGGVGRAGGQGVPRGGEGPTRAHPYLPHTGRLGHAARRWSVADHFWDTAEGRVVPRPVSAPSRSTATTAWSRSTSSVSRCSTRTRR